jgi:hypothetical protein
MKQTIAILAPFLAALAGAGLWILASVVGRWEIGLLALGIGAAVGAATRWGARRSSKSTGRHSISRGLLGAALTLLAIGGGKLGAAWLELELEYRDYLSQAEQAGSMTATAETAMFHLALDLVEAREAEGIKLAWPAGKNADTAFRPLDLPPEFWQETLKKWEEMPEHTRKRHIEVAQAALKAFSESERTGWGISDLREMLLQNLDLTDLFFTFLATVAAYRIAIAQRGISDVSSPKGT